METAIAQRTAFQSLMNDYAVYNAWANRQLVDWLRTKSGEKMEAEVPSSFPTIKKTLLHIYKTQLFFLDVIKKQQRSYDEDAVSFYEDDPVMHVPQLFDSIVEQSDELAFFLQNLKEDGFLEKVITTTPWFASEQPRYELIQHCINHSTYHRGQIVTIGRNLGITDAPMTDFNFYLLRAK